MLHRLTTTYYLPGYGTQSIYAERYSEPHNLFFRDGAGAQIIDRLL